MKESRIGILVLLAIFLVGCAQPQTIPYEAVRGGRGQGFRKQPYKCMIDQADCKPGEVSGQVTKITLETFECFAEPGLALEVNTPAEGMVHVHLGPLWLLERREPDLRIGEQVSIQVLCYNVGGKSRLIAKEISHQGITTQLYDHLGLPYWAAARPR
ncbi:MAG: hypothetical protein C4567_03470 [Deltaproteobacteria bacterium]|nr:MAG: hypothetical protein C4567_03470 [Deltaproteobacteria bacterium]